MKDSPHCESCEVIDSVGNALCHCGRCNTERATLRTRLSLYGNLGAEVNHPSRYVDVYRFFQHSHKIAPKIIICNDLLNFI